MNIKRDDRVYDTVGILSPDLTNHTVEKIRKSCVEKRAVNLGNGELMYNFTTGCLEGTWDNRILVKLQDRYWIKGENEPEFTGKQDTKLYIEGSVHKAMSGHNVYGGPEDFRLAIKWFVSLVSKLLDVELPDSDEWYVIRVDVAECYDLGAAVAVKYYINALGQCKYPRRKVYTYADETVMVVGRTTAVKLYHKGPDFWKHDRKRLKQVSRYTEERIAELQQIAGRILRAEVEVKSRKLKDDFGEIPKVFQITDDYLNSVAQADLQKLLKEGESEMSTVRTLQEVQARIQMAYPSTKARNLFRTWLSLTSIGEQATQADMAKRTFLLHKRQLLDIGVSWVNQRFLSDEDMTVIPTGFAPIRTSEYRITKKSEYVEYLLQSVA